LPEAARPRRGVCRPARRLFPAGREEERPGPEGLRRGAAAAAAAAGIRCGETKWLQRNRKRGEDKQSKRKKMIIKECRKRKKKPDDNNATVD